MKNRKWLMKSLTLILIFLSVNASSGYAQGSKTSSTSQKTSPAQSANDELLKAAEKAIAEAEALRRIKSLQAEEIDALQAKIAALSELVEIERQRAEEWKKASQERATANALDEKRIALFEETVRDAKAEITRIRAERDSARRQQKVWGVVGLVLGALAVLVGARN